MSETNNKATISLVLPYYNEVGFIEATLSSIAGQRCRDFVLILVNNASSDESEAICRTLTSTWNDIHVVHCQEHEPGKIHALRHGIAKVETTVFATLDADTIYPPDYVGFISAQFAIHQDSVMVMAADIYGNSAAPAQRMRCWAILLLSKLFPHKCHTGAFGQAFRTREFREAGGYDPNLWDFVLEDHEIVHRVGKLGRQVYSAHHFCAPSSRRANRTAVTWNRFESLLYTLLPNRWMDWYFYRFLAKRFSARGLGNKNLRAQPWMD